MGNANLRANGQLIIKYKQTQALKSIENNSRTHSAHQVDKIIACFKEFSFTNQIIIKEKNTIIEG